MELLKVYQEAIKIIEEKKVITESIKQRLILLGFVETKIGSKNIHEITSKQVKTEFFGYDIAIGLASKSISYGDGYLYKAMTYKRK